VALNSWLAGFGSSKVKLKPFLQQVEALAASTNPQVRTEAINFYKEAFKWMKDGIRPLISNLK